MIVKKHTNASCGRAHTLRRVDTSEGCYNASAGRAYASAGRAYASAGRAYASAGRAFTLIEIIIAAAVVTLVVVTAVVILRSGRKESSHVLQKIASQQETRLAFRRMCNEIRQGTRLILPENDCPLKDDTYHYLEENDDRHVHYGDAANCLMFENYEGDIISYFLYEHQDAAGEVTGRELRRLNVTRRFEEASEQSRVVARGVKASALTPSVFTVGKAYPGKQLSSVLVKLSIRESDEEDNERAYTLVSSVFLRNLEPLVRTGLEPLEDRNLKFVTN